MKEFYVPPGQKMVQVTGTVPSPWEWVSNLGQFTVADASGASYQPKGAWTLFTNEANEQRAFARYSAEGEIATTDPVNAGTPGEVTLAFVVPEAAQLTNVLYQGQQVGAITATTATPPPADPAQQQMAQLRQRLVGSWESTAGTTIRTYEFRGDGTYAGTKKDGPADPKNVKGKWDVASVEGGGAEARIRLTNTAGTKENVIAWIFNGPDQASQVLADGKSITFTRKK